MLVRFSCSSEETPLLGDLQGAGRHCELPPRWRREVALHHKPVLAAHARSEAVSMEPTIASERNIPRAPRYNTQPETMEGFA